MKKRLIVYSTAFLLFLSALYINHRVYAESQLTRSQIQTLLYIRHQAIKRKRVKNIADYMYSRIKFYQDLEPEGFNYKFYMYWYIHQEILEKQKEK